MVQKAELIYSDRINTYRRLIDLDRKIAELPQETEIAEIVELSIRNRLCREELTRYNDTGEFLYKHPILIVNTLQRELTQLLLSSPDAFLSEYKNCELNLSRYRSWLGSSSKAPEQKRSAQQMIKKYTAKQEVMSAILKDNLYERKTAEK